MTEATAVTAPTPRAAKFRQAAFVYLHIGLLYEAVVLVAWREGHLTDARGPVWVWLLVGAAVVGLVFWALWARRSAWVARVVWALGVFRLPALVEGAFLPDAARIFPAAFYLTALVFVVVNLWMLARAGWDL